MTVDFITLRPSFEASFAALSKRDQALMVAHLAALADAPSAARTSMVAVVEGPDVEWRIVPIAPDYEVSSLGQVRRLVQRKGYAAGRPLRPYVNRSGYHEIDLRVAGRTRRLRIGLHRVVALAFHGEPPSPDHVAAHGDGIRAHNTRDNIRWASRRENWDDFVEHTAQNVGERNGNAVLSDEQVAAIRIDPRPHSDIADAYGVSRQHVTALKAGLWRTKPTPKKTTTANADRGRTDPSTGKRKEPR